MSRKRTKRTDSALADSTTEVPDFTARLAQHGEAFMQMFDDAHNIPPPPKRVAVSSEAAATSSSASDTEELQTKGDVTSIVETFADVWHDPGKPRRRAGAAGQQPFDQGSLSSKAARRRFMSGKAADIHHQSTAASQQQQVRQKQQQQRQQRRSDQPLNRDDFLNMQKEVQQVGASALDRKARRKFDAWQLQNVNATPEKPGRLSAAIGKGMAKKQAARDQKAHEEAIASGMIKLKGSGKKRSAPTSIEKGLLEDGGLFKAGMLRVKGSASKGAKFKKAPSNTKRAFSSGKIGDLNSNSQKAWNKAQQRNTKPTSKKPRR